LLEKIIPLQALLLRLGRVEVSLGCALVNEPLRVLLFQLHLRVPVLHERVFVLHQGAFKVVELDERVAHARVRARKVLEVGPVLFADFHRLLAGGDALVELFQAKVGRRQVIEVDHVGGLQVRRCLVVCDRGLKVLLRVRCVPELLLLGRVCGRRAAHQHRVRVSTAPRRRRAQHTRARSSAQAVRHAVGASGQAHTPPASPAPRSRNVGAHCPAAAPRASNRFAGRSPAIPRAPGANARCCPVPAAHRTPRMAGPAAAAQHTMAQHTTATTSPRCRGIAWKIPRQPGSFHAEIAPTFSSLFVGASTAGGDTWKRASQSTMTAGCDTRPVTASGSIRCRRGAARPPQMPAAA